MIIFVNGKSGFGSPPPGKKFWTSRNEGNSTFVKGAIHYFDDEITFFTDKDYSIFSNVQSRIRAGHLFAQENFEKITSHEMGKGINFVTFSMGAAFGEGMISYLSGRDLRIKNVIHINAYQASKISFDKETRNFTLDYQLKFDPVVNNWFLTLIQLAKPGPIIHADQSIKEFPSIPPFKLLFVHRSPITIQGEKFWKNLYEKNKHFKALARLE